MNNLNMDEHIEQLATFLRDAPHGLRAALMGDFFDFHLKSALESNKPGYVLSTLMAATDEFLKLKPDDPHPPKWIDYNKPLVSRTGLYDIIMEWKTEGNDVYNFEALRCYVLAHCFQPENPASW